MLVLLTSIRTTRDARVNDGELEREHPLEDEAGLKRGAVHGRCSVVKATPPMMIVRVDAGALCWRSNDHPRLISIHAGRAIPATSSSENSGAFIITANNRLLLRLTFSYNDLSQ